MNARDTRVEEKTAWEVLEAFGRAPIAGWLRAQRWFGSKGRAVEALAVSDALVLDGGPPALALAVLDVRTGRESDERYVVPVLIDVRGGEVPGAIAHVEVGRATAIVCDATDTPQFARNLLSAIASNMQRQSTGGVPWSARTTEAFAKLGSADSLLAFEPRRIGGEQSNTSYAFGDRMLLKLLRKLEPGVHPETEMLNFLNRCGFAHVPRLLASLSVEQGQQATTVATLQQFVPCRGDAWRTTLDEVCRAIHAHRDPTGPAEPMRRLGEITGAMHAALASSQSDANFDPQPAREEDGRVLAATLSERFEAISHAFREHHAQWTAPTRESVRVLLEELGPALAVWTPQVGEVASWGARIRVHGDYHLGQVLRTDDGFVIIDFEGEPARPLAARRERSLALRDVAGMLRSFDYARHVLARELGSDARPALDAWYEAARDAFVAGHEAAVAKSRAALLPASASGRARALAVFELEKALYEVLYEIDHRPDWIAIAASGARDAARRLRGSQTEAKRA